MAASCRFAFAIHILAVLARQRPRAVTSELLARSVNTNPVVVRRLLSQLRRAGFVSTQTGAGGGATLQRLPEEIPLDTVYRTFEPISWVSKHPHEPNPECPVGRRIVEVLSEVCASAERAFDESLRQLSLADVLSRLDCAARLLGGNPTASRKTS
jgi:Rrf2 family protein